MTMEAVSLSWQPSATLGVLRKRAEIIAIIRDFFAKRQVLEVETPLLSQATVTDPCIASIPAYFQSSCGAERQTCYLQTSPEYAMKRLLAAGSGAIYQITKAFRQGDYGRFHNPEFTMLEWYRPQFDHHALMDEMDLLLQQVLATSSAERMTYSNLFAKYLAINPHTATIDELKACALRSGCELMSELPDRNAWIDLLLTHCIEPYLGQDRPLFLYDFPIDQAALARIRFDETPPVASRFEVYYRGIELANGFHELQNSTEQRERFLCELNKRQELQLPMAPMDENFLSALQFGLPDCAGVALGIDRLVMLAVQCHAIQDVLSFDFSRA